MKGLREQTGGDNVKYLVVKHNSLCEESKSPLPGFEPVDVRNPQTNEITTKWIKRYEVEAMITNIEFRRYEHEASGRLYLSWRVSLDAAGVPCILDLPLDSSAATRFMKVAENIDFSQPVELRAWKDKSKPNKIAFFIGQGVTGEGKSIAVPQKYTRKEPNGCPEPVKDDFTNEWDFKEQVKFLYRQMVNVVIPRLQALRASTESATTQAPPPHEDYDDDEYYEANRPSGLRDAPSTQQPPPTRDGVRMCTVEQRKEIERVAKEHGLETSEKLARHCESIHGAGLTELTFADAIEYRKTLLAL